MSDITQARERLEALAAQIEHRPRTCHMVFGEAAADLRTILVRIDSLEAENARLISALDHDTTETERELAAAKADLAEARASVEDMLPVLEDIDDSDECDAEELCSSPACRSAGCIVDKIRRARTACPPAGNEEAET